MILPQHRVVGVAEEDKLIGSPMAMVHPQIKVIYMGHANCIDSVALALVHAFRGSSE